jgi:hypothetical protein
MGLSKYKYLVVNGCSQTMGAVCHIDLIWPKLLADRLGLKLINLASSASGWYTLETTTTSFIHNNKDIVHECLFILQKSMLERGLDYANLSIYRSDIWEDYNIKYIPENSIRIHGYKKWEKYTQEHLNNPKHINSIDDKFQSRDMYGMFEQNVSLTYLPYFPEHRHYPNSRHHWKPIINDKEEKPKFIQEQIDELLLHFGQRMLSFHLFLKSMGADHIMVDGYSPFLSYKLNFKHYYDTDEEFDWVKRFWSKNPDERDEGDVMLYDFKNTKSGWIFDQIDNRYKIDDVVLWSLYQFKTDPEWCPDGGHAGPKGMELIEKVIFENLQEKSWIN